MDQVVRDEAEAAPSVSIPEPDHRLKTPDAPAAPAVGQPPATGSSPVGEAEQDYQLAVARSLAEAWQDAEEEALDSLWEAMTNIGLQPIGETDEEVRFDGRMHDSEEVLRPGDPAVVVRNGWELRQDDRRIHLASARVRAAAVHRDWVSLEPTTYGPPWRAAFLLDRSLPVIAIDFGNSFTKVALRRDENEPSRMLTDDTLGWDELNVCIPTVAVLGPDDVWRFGSDVVRLGKSARQVQRNWKPRFFEDEPAAARDADRRAEADCNAVRPDGPGTSDTTDDEDGRY